MFVTRSSCDNVNFLWWYSISTKLSLVASDTSRNIQKKLWCQVIATIESAPLKHPSAMKQIGVATKIWRHTIFFVVPTCGNQKWVVVIDYCNRKKKLGIQIQYSKPFNYNIQNHSITIFKTIRVICRFIKINSHSKYPSNETQIWYSHPNYVPRLNCPWSIQCS